MIALFILFIILTNVLIIFVALFVRLVLRLQTSLSGIACLSPEPSLGLAHLVELLAALMVIILEDLVLLVAVMLILQLFDNSVCLLLALRVLQVVGVELIFQEINIGVLLNVDVVEPLKFLFEAFIFFLVFGLNVFNTLKSLFSSF